MKAAKEEKEGNEDRRYLFEFHLYFGVFTRQLCSEECLPGLFENSRFSQITRWNAWVVFGGWYVQKSVFLYCWFRRCRLASSRHGVRLVNLISHVFAANGRVKRHPFYATVESEVRSNFSFTQGWFLFRACVDLISCQDLLWIFDFLNLFYSIYFIFIFLITTKTRRWWPAR